MCRRLASIGLLSLLALPALADRTADQLRQAVSMARGGRAADAANALPSMDAATADHLLLLRDAARALEPADALRPLAAILRLKPGDPAARRSADSIWRKDPAPAKLHADALPAVPAEIVTWPVAFKGLSVVTLRPSAWIAGEPIRRSGSVGPFVSLASVYTRFGDSLTLAGVVYAQDGVSPDTFGRIARFCGALSHVGAGFDAARGRTDGPIRVWLESDGPADCETTGRDIVVRGANGPRSALEWMRQLAHEWGHAVVPGVGGFREPEPWANGDLGERLFLPALAREGLNAAWDQPADVASYEVRYVRPLIEAFARSGPVPTLVADTSRKGYDHFLGAALYIAATYGAETLAEALGSMAGGRSSDFVDAIPEVLRTRRTVIATRRDGAGGPRPVCIPVTGVHILNGSGVRVAGKPVAGPVPLPAGWTMVEWTGTLSVTPQTGGRR